MKVFFIALSGAALVAIAPAIAQTAQPAPARGHAAKVETRADVQSRIAAHFARFDTNRDGFVTQAEADALVAQRDKKREERAQKRAERRDPARIFARIDADKDGKITKAEAEAAHGARAAAKGKPVKADAVAIGGLFDRADSNKDGVVTSAEFAAAPHPKMDRAGMRHGRGGMFGMADLNKDGRVTLAEAEQAALQRFDRVDLNRDGKLTPEERQQARQLLRVQRHKG